jgi:predicted membrane GTPase involved in stress response
MKNSGPSPYTEGGGGATMDSADLEREQGMTIASAITSLPRANRSINITGTPGRTDVTLEAEPDLALGPISRRHL